MMEMYKVFKIHPIVHKMDVLLSKLCVDKIDFLKFLFLPHLEAYFFHLFSWQYWVLNLSLACGQATS